MGGISTHEPQSWRWITETLLATQVLWRQRTLILLGDVFYTDQAMDRMMHFPRPLGFYARAGASRYSSSRYGEIFAIAVSDTEADLLVKHLRIAIRDAESGGRGKLWQAYRSMCGFPLNANELEKEILHPLRDRTDDIDGPDEWEQMQKRYTRAFSDSRIQRAVEWVWTGTYGNLRYGYYTLKSQRKKFKKYLKSINFKR